MANILLIDDESSVRKTIRVILEAQGHHVAEAENGREGLRLCVEHIFDLVISDIIMPEKEGIETIVELRSAHPDLRILAISGGGRIQMGDFLKMAASLGANDTLPKPFLPEQLIEKVNALCSTERHLEQ